MELEHELIPQIVFNIGPLQVTSTVVYTWIIMAIVTLLFWWLGRNLKVRPTRFQNALEWLVEMLDGIIRDMIPEQSRIFLPLVGTLAIFIAAANLGGLIPGLRAPTTDLNTPLALAIVVGVTVAILGIVLWAVLLGAMLPLLLQRLGFDPATVSSPMVATLMDVSGLVIYMVVAVSILRGTVL